jgi:hypothetical protein
LKLDYKDIYAAYERMKVDKKEQKEIIKEQKLLIAKYKKRALKYKN